MYMDSYAAGEKNIVALSDEEISSVDGGVVPIFLAAAVLATTVEFSFVAGVFDGIYNKYH